MSFPHKNNRFYNYSCYFGLVCGIMIACSLFDMQDSFFTLGKAADGRVFGQSGVYFYILESLALLLGFKYRLVLPDDGQYGLLGSDGSWNGIIGMLIRNESDLTAASLYVLPARQKLIKYSLTLTHDEIVHVTKAVDSVCGEDRNFLARPFQNQVWLLIYIIVGSSLLLQATFRLGFSKYYHIIEGFSVWAIISQTVGLGSSKIPPKLHWRRITTVSMIIFTAFMLKIYSSSVVSSFSLKKCGSPYDTIAALAKAVSSKRLSVGTLQTLGSLVMSLENSKSQQLRDLGRHFRYVNSFPEAFHDIVYSNFALVIDRQYFISFMNNHMFSPKKVHYPREPVFKMNIAMAYGNSFPFQEIFDQGLGSLKSYGLLQKFEAEERFFIEKDLALAEAERRDKMQYIGMSDLQYTVALFYMVLSISFVVVLVKTFSEYLQKYM